MRKARVLSGLAALAIAPALVVVSGVAFQDGTAPGSMSSGLRVVGAGEQLRGGEAAASVTILQERLRVLPEDFGAWSSLGYAYLAQARTTADPSYYPRAEQAFARSLEVSPNANSDALAGQAALANARHDFAAGRDLATRATQANPYDATALGVLADAQIELGDFDTALTTIQQMVDLRPGVPSYTRVSYSYELRGDAANAQFAMEQALTASSTVADASFALLHLGDLAFGTGDLDAAAARYAAGLARDPASVPLLAGSGRVAAARGDTEQALEGYAEVVRRLPQPSYLVEYGELLESLGRDGEAREQYAVAEASSRLFSAEGVVPDVEVVLHEADHGDPARAVALAEELAKTRNSPQVRDAQAWALHVAGRDAEALDHARAAQRLGTRSALWDYHRGVIEAALGMSAEARASLTRSLETNAAFSPLHGPRAAAALSALGGAA